MVPDKKNRGVSTLAVNSLLTQNATDAELWISDTMRIRDQAETWSRQETEGAAFNHFKVVSCVQADGNCLFYGSMVLWSLWWLHWTVVLCAVVTLIIKNGGRSVEWFNVSQNICRCFNQVVNSRSYGNFWMWQFDVSLYNMIVISSMVWNAKKG